MDRLTAMRVFTDVAQSGSFTASADRLDMSRAMVTRYVAELEQWLGARLLQRTTRCVTLTDPGEQCLRRCLQILAQFEEVENEIAPTDGTLRGQLRLTSCMSFAHAHLAAAISDFLKFHPQLKIDLDVSDSTVNLVEARIDLAIRISSAPDPALIARPLAQCQSVLIAAPLYLATHGWPQQPDELAQHQCLGYANLSRNEWQLTRGKETRIVRVTTRFTANESTVLLHGAMAGAGIAPQPRYLVNALIAEGCLQIVLPEWQPPPLTIYALCTPHHQPPPALRTLLDFLVARFAKMSW